MLQYSFIAISLYHDQLLWWSKYSSQYILSCIFKKNYARTYYDEILFHRNKSISWSCIIDGGIITANGFFIVTNCYYDTNKVVVIYVLVFIFTKYVLLWRNVIHYNKLVLRRIRCVVICFWYFGPLFCPCACYTSLCVLLGFGFWVFFPAKLPSSASTPMLANWIPLFCSGFFPL